MTALTRTMHLVNRKEQPQEEPLPLGFYAAGVVALLFALLALAVDLNADAWIGR